MSIDQTFKGLITWKHDADGTRQEGKESQPDEFHTHTEKELVGGSSIDVTVPNCGDGRQNEIEGIYVNFNFEIVFGQRLVSCSQLLLLYEAQDPSTFLPTNDDPYARHQVRHKNDGNFKFYEINIFIYFLTGVAEPAHQNIFGEVVELEKNSIIVDKTANLVEGLWLLQSDKPRQRSHTIKDEIWFEILQSYLGKFWLFLILFYEIT